MQILHDAISPERLAEAKKLFEQETAPSPEIAAQTLDAKIRSIRDLEAEIAEKEAFARRQRDAVR